MPPLRVTVPKPPLFAVAAENVAPEATVTLVPLPSAGDAEGQNPSIDRADACDGVGRTADRERSGPVLEDALAVNRAGDGVAVRPVADEVSTPIRRFAGQR